MVSVAGRRLFGLAVSGVIVGAVIAACRPNGDVGYVEIKTVPAAPITLTALYIDSAKLAPIRKGSAILRQPTGTLKLQADGTCRRAGAVVRDRRGAQSHHHGHGLGAGTSAALPMPQQRHRRGPRLRELNVIPDCRVIRRPKSEPESIITMVQRNFRADYGLTNRGYGFRARAFGRAPE